MGSYRAEEDKANWFLTCGNWDSIQYQTYLHNHHANQNPLTHPFFFPQVPLVLLPPLINLSSDRFLGVMGPFKLQGERGH